MNSAGVSTRVHSAMSRRMANCPRIWSSSGSFGQCLSAGSSRVDSASRAVRPRPLTAKHLSGTSCADGLTSESSDGAVELLPEAKQLEAMGY